MTLSIDTLKGMGAFTGAPVRKQIKWKSNGEEHEAEVNVKPLSYSTAVSDLMSRDAIASRIASSILDDDMKPVFTLEDITGEADEERGPLCRALTMELLRVIGEVSDFDKKKPQKSPAKKKSGTSLSSPE